MYHYISRMMHVFELQQRVCHYSPGNCVRRPEGNDFLKRLIVEPFRQLLCSRLKGLNRLAHFGRLFRTLYIVCYLHGRREVSYVCCCFWSVERVAEGKWLVLCGQVLTPASRKRPSRCRVFLSKHPQWRLHVWQQI